MHGAGSDATDGVVNVRQAYIQGIDGTVNGLGVVPNAATASGSGIVVPAGGVAATTCQRRYQINLALGLLTQDKLLPVKFMASQLAIELSLAQESECMIVTNQSGTSGSNPTYVVSNFNMIPEILEFDASYDSMFLRGLQDGGVPLKFSSWHTFIFSTGAASAFNLLVQERSRSVKALFAVQRRNPSNLYADQGATIFSSNPGSTLQNYQFRIGGRYFPAQPVQCSTAVGSSLPNGGAEAYVELQKALNIVGDYRLSTSCNVLRWGLANTSVTVGTNPITAQDADYSCTPTGYSAAGAATYAVKSLPFSGTLGSACFAMAIDLETSNGIEISGLNAEEQSDISLIANYSAVQASGYNLEVYSYYDAMIILRENNVLELIQ